MFYVKYLSVENTRSVMKVLISTMATEVKLTEVDIKRNNNNYFTCLMCFYHIDIHIFLNIIWTDFFEEFSSYIKWVLLKKKYHIYSY